MKLEARQGGRPTTRISVPAVSHSCRHRHRLQQEAQRANRHIRAGWVPTTHQEEDSTLEETNWCAILGPGAAVVCSSMVAAVEIQMQRLQPCGQRAHEKISCNRHADRAVTKPPKGTAPDTRTQANSRNLSDEMENKLTLW